MHQCTLIKPVKETKLSKLAFFCLKLSLSLPCAFAGVLLSLKFRMDPGNNKLAIHVIT